MPMTNLDDKPLMNRDEVLDLTDLSRATIDRREKRRTLSSKGAPVAATGRLEDGRDTRLDSISATSC